MIELRGVTYRYPGHRRAVLRDVDLVIGEGEIVGLVGPNDSGKSSLCLLASGLAPVVIGGTLDGEVRIDGQRTVELQPHELATRVGIVFADPAAQRSGVSGSVFEEIALGPVNLGCTAAESVARARRAMARLGIETLADRDPRRLSGGQAQLVAIASILAMAPRHLVLDEPTAQLDPAGSRLVGAALRALAAAGTALLIAEHRTDLLEAVCARIIALDDGEVVADGPAGEVLSGAVLPAIGVEPPARVRLIAALAASGLSLPTGALSEGVGPEAALP